MLDNKIMAEYRTKLLNRKNCDESFTQEEVLLLKNMEMFNGDKRKKLAHDFQKFISTNYEIVITAEIVAEVYFNEGIKNFAEIAKKLNFYGKSEEVNGGTQKNGQLCRRHMMLLVDSRDVIVEDEVYKLKCLI